MASLEHEKLLCQYAGLLTEANERTNLVSRRLDLDGISDLVFTFAETLEACGVAGNDDLSDMTLLDIGSGGGIPGIPIAIRHPGLTVFLNESRRLRVLEIQDFVEHLHLANAAVVPGRAETLLGISAFHDGVDLVTAFGVAKAPAVLDLVAPLVATEGVALVSIPADPSKEDIATYHLSGAVRGFGADVLHHVLQGRSVLRLRRLPEP